MELGEIFRDALSYPVNNIVSLVIYMVLGIILGISVAFATSAIVAALAVNDFLAVLGSGIIGIAITLVIGFIISGYELDIIKYGIERSNESPRIDVKRQFSNGVKLFVVQIVYMIIPILIAAVLAIVFQHWLATVIEIILVLIFSFALIMGQCRLAKTEDLGYALSIGEAIGDISKVGIVKLVLFLICIFIITFVLMFIITAITQWSDLVGGILMGILSVYLTFFIGRATGLLYSDV